MGDAKRENRLLFCALALFFFVFLESTLFFQANLAQHGGHGPLPLAAPHPRRQHPGPAGLSPQEPSCRRKRPTGVHGNRHRPWGRVPCRRRFRILAAGDRVHGCGWVLPYRARRRHRVLGNVRKVAQHRAIRNADRGSHALGVLAQIPLLEFTSNHLIEAAVLSAGIIALGAINARICRPDARSRTFPHSGNNAGEITSNARARRMAPRPYDPSHRRHRDLRLGAAVLRAVQHALHLYRHRLGPDQPIHQRDAPHPDGHRRLCRPACCSTCTGRVTWASSCSG